MAVSKRIDGVLLIREWPGAKGMATYWCPGCKRAHSITFGPEGTETWTWDGNAEHPTFAPSILANGTRGASSEEWNRRHPRCHSFVREGRIEYLSDCEHAMAGTTVDMVPLPSRYAEFLGE